MLGSQLRVDQAILTGQYATTLYFTAIGVYEDQQSSSICAEEMFTNKITQHRMLSFSQLSNMMTMVFGLMDLDTMLNFYMMKVMYFCDLVQPTCTGFTKCAIDSLFMLFVSHLRGELLCCKELGQNNSPEGSLSRQDKHSILSTFSISYFIDFLADQPFDSGLLIAHKAVGSFNCVYEKYLVLYVLASEVQGPFC